MQPAVIFKPANAHHSEHLTDICNKSVYRGSEACLLAIYHQYSVCCSRLLGQADKEFP